MEIEVGEYVRDRAGNIARVIKNNNDIFEIELNSGVRINQFIEFMTKHSKNIIDLLEVGDIVMYKIGIIKATGIGRIGIVNKFNDARSGKEVTLIDGYKPEEIDILKILTREQFEANCYKTDIK